VQSQEVLDEFFRSFKISLNLASLYSNDHPYYLKSIDDLKIKTDQALQFIDSIKIAVTSTTLLLNGKSCEKVGVSQEIVNILHLRKIKSIEIKRGATLKELVCLLSTICLKAKEIFRSGGIGKIIQKEAVSNISVEELDYSLLLKDAGEEVKDIWVFLLKEIVEKQEVGKAGALADSFPEIVKKFKTNDLFEDEELRNNISRFLEFLKKTKSEKFTQCQKAVLAAVLREKKLPEDYSLDKIKSLFNDLSEEELANSLLEQVATDDNFDSNNFNLFLKLTSNNQHQKIAESFTSQLKNSNLLKDRVEVSKRIQGLFSTPENTYISEIYRNSLGTVLQNISFTQGFVFDQESLRQNYRFILLSLLATENEEDKLAIILKRIADVLKAVSEDKDWGYLKDLSVTLNVRLKEKAALANPIREINLKLSEFFEGLVWGESSPPEELGYFIDNLQVTSRDAEYYINKIFHENRVSVYGLKLFFKFFPQKVGIFYENLERESGNLKLISSIIEAAKSIHGLVAVEVLKYIYNTSSKLMKIEALKAMHGLSGFDAAFLLPVISGEDLFLKKEVLPILRKDPVSLRRALELLFSIKNPWGTKNNILLGNMDLIDELEVKEAQDFIIVLSKKRFFWNSKVRIKATMLLEKWHDRKN